MRDENKTDFFLIWTFAEVKMIFNHFEFDAKVFTLPDIIFMIESVSFSECQGSLIYYYDHTHDDR